MNIKIKTAVISMLTEAYYQLGIQRVKELEGWVNEAMRYLSEDREHYIEAVEPEIPEHAISVRDGRICKLIPLAREVTEEQKKDHLRRNTRIVSVMVTETAVRYVRADYCEEIYPDAADNTYSCPVYNYIELEDISRKLQVCAPGDIRPPATQKDWEIFCRIFEAFARLCRDQYVNVTPHKTERAMLAASHRPVEELTVDGEKIVGKVIPLATSQSLEEEADGDHRHSRHRELNLLVAGENIQYLMKIRHNDQYIRKVAVDDAPGGWICEPAEEKQEITYEFVKLTDIRQKMLPLYY